MLFNYLYLRNLCVMCTLLLCIDGYICKFRLVLMFFLLWNLDACDVFDDNRKHYKNDLLSSVHIDWFRLRVCFYSQPLLHGMIV